MPLPPEYTLRPEPDLPFRIYGLNLEHHATGIGYLCFQYARLELQLGSLIQAFLNCSSEARRAIVDATGTSITARCTLIKKLAHTSRFSNEWRELLSTVLDKITDEITPHRNRLVHDLWLDGEQQGTQLDFRLFERRAEARAPKSLTPAQKQTRELQFIWDLVRDIYDIGFELALITSDVHASEHASRPQERALQSVQHLRTSRPSRSLLVIPEPPPKSPQD